MRLAKVRLTCVFITILDVRSVSALCGLVGRIKGCEATGGGIEPPCRQLYFLHFEPETIPKKSTYLGPKDFVITPVIKYKASTGCGFESSISCSFLKLIPKIILRYIFYTSKSRLSYEFFEPYGRWRLRPYQACSLVRETLSNLWYFLFYLNL